MILRANRTFFSWLFW